MSLRDQTMEGKFLYTTNYNYNNNYKKNYYPYCKLELWDEKLNEKACL